MMAIHVLFPVSTACTFDCYCVSAGTLSATTRCLYRTSARCIYVVYSVTVLGLNRHCCICPVMSHRVGCSVGIGQIDASHSYCSLFFVDRFGPCWPQGRYAINNLFLYHHIPTSNAGYQTCFVFFLSLWNVFAQVLHARSPL